jgi:hypothetical protein
MALPTSNVSSPSNSQTSVASDLPAVPSGVSNYNQLGMAVPNGSQWSGQPTPQGVMQLAIINQLLRTDFWNDVQNSSGPSQFAQQEQQLGFTPMPGTGSTSQDNTSNSSPLQGSQMASSTSALPTSGTLGPISSAQVTNTANPGSQISTDQIKRLLGIP